MSGELLQGRSWATVGFHTWYRRQGVTYVALQLAQLAEEEGHCTTLLSFAYHDRGVDSLWDDKAQSDRRIFFSDWVERCSMVIWPEFVKPDCLEISKRLGASTVLIPMWEQLEKKHLEVLPSYDHIVCVSEACQEILTSQLSLKNTQYIPFSLALPRLNRSVSPERIRLFYPAAGPQSRRIAVILLPILEKILAEKPYVYLTISYLRQWPKEALPHLNRLKKRFLATKQLKVLSNLDYPSHLQLYADHDLTLWPTTQEGLGLLGMESLSQGTPVLAWDLPPINDYLVHAQNSWLMPCVLERNWLGVPQAQPDPDVLERALRYLIDDKQTLASLRSVETESRANLHSQRWKNLFSGK